MNESQIFKAAASLPAEDRASYLDEACKDDVRLRSEVESLLAGHDAAASFLERPAAVGADAADATLGAERVNEGPGATIGPYRIMEQVGEGGFGLVFVAEQQHPVRRKVALKIIKPGMDTREVIARFEAERQALALMDHPNIAKVHDAGTTESGRPYFVMELIRGIPLMEYCDQQELTNAERLRLFVDVCRAVQHAHAKGVIHRDLKPSNILISPHDGVPVVKIIDFGIAKAIGQQLTDKTIYTRLTQMIGTPLYMSPEQAEINALDVDIRSDVYSLGVLLYELLTGTTPFDRDRFSRAAYDEIKRIIREEEPPSPSRRLSTLGDTATGVSMKRKTEPARLLASLKGELDWIVMCCLEKDRSRRYQTAAELTADLERYLRDEPVVVVPPSRAYKAKKLIRRYRAPLAVGVGYVLLSAIALVTSVALMQSAKQRADLARNQADHTSQLNAELKSTLSKLRDVIHERAVAAALSGDDAVFRGAIADLAQLEDSDRDRRHLTALHNLFSGHVREAVADLESMVAADPSDTSTWAILEVAYDDFALDLDGESRTTGMLQRLRPKTEFEKLMTGFAFTEEDVRPLRELVESNPGWAVARAMLARALCRFAWSHSDSSSLADARREVEAALILRPTSPFVLSIQLEVATAEFVFRSRNPVSSESAELARKECKRLIDVLNTRFRNYPFGIRRIAEFYSCTEEFAEAMGHWKRLITEFDSSVGIFYYLPIAFLQGKQPEIDEELIFPHYFLYTGERAKALHAARSTKWQTDSLGRTWNPGVFRLCGLEEQAQAALRAAMPLTDSHAPWVANVIKLMAGQMSEGDVFQAIDDDPSLETHHLMLLAFHSLSAPGGREKSRAYVEQALARDRRTNDVYYWCKALKKKFDEDSAWPASLQNHVRGER